MDRDLFHLEKVNGIELRRRESFDQELAEFTVGNPNFGDRSAPRDSEAPYHILSIAIEARISH